MTMHNKIELHSNTRYLESDPPPDPCVCRVISPADKLLAHFTFQHGPLAGAEDTNGVMLEDLIAIAIERLRGLNTGDFACRENSHAISKLEEAEMWLGRRTLGRIDRGVEGTNTP